MDRSRCVGRTVVVCALTVICEGATVRIAPMGTDVFPDFLSARVRRSPAFQSKHRTTDYVFLGHSWDIFSQQSTLSASTAIK